MYNREMIDVSQSHGGFGGAAMGMWAFIIFVILIIFFVFYRKENDGHGGNYGHFGGYPAPLMAYGYPHGGKECCGPSNCQLEVREILDAKQTQLDICKDTAKVIETNNKGYETILAKMSQDALTAVTAKNVEQANVISELKQTIAMNAQFGALNHRLDGIECHMLKKPEVHGVGTVCPPDAILRGFRDDRRDDCGCRG